MKLNTIFGLMAGCMLALPAAAKTAVVDGFTVTLDPKPIKGHLPVPQGVTNGLVYLQIGGPTDGGATGTDPFAYSPTLIGVTPYISVQGSGSVGFSYSAPVTTFTILWGTPDSYNQLSFYDSNGGQIGASIMGGDLAAAFNLNILKTPYYISIASPTPISSVVLSTSSCCFEFVNVSAK